MARSSFQPTEETHDLITEVIDQAPDTAIQQEDSSMKPPCANPVEMWPIDRPKPHPDNARKHSDEQIAQLAKSIESFQAVRARSLVGPSPPWSEGGSRHRAHSLD